MVKCIPPNDPDAVWPFCPSPVPAAMFAFLFFVLTVTHFTQAIMYRKVYSWVIIVAAIWQCAAYGIREASVYMPTNSGIYSIWFVMVLIGPLWINAFVYMVVARMVWNFLPNKKLGGIKSWRFGMWFVIFDIIAFFVQAAGASMASGSGLTQTEIMRGLHIYMIGVGVQQAFIVVFTGLLIRFQLRFKRENPYHSDPLPMRLIYVLYTVLGLITVRIIYRLVEYSSGINSTIPTHEAFMYVFETVPMFFAVLAFNLVHPGKVMPGKESNIPGRKQRKALMKQTGSVGYREVNNHSGTELGLTAGREAYPARAHTPEPIQETGLVEGYSYDNYRT